MFSIFKKQKKTAPAYTYAAYLAWDDEMYATSIADLVKNMDVATRAHVLVAYQNLKTILSVAHELEKPNEKTSLEAYIETLAEKSQASKGDEIKYRRWTWFLLAANLLRIERIAGSNAQILKCGADAWELVAQAAPHLKALLPKNVVWSQDEKAWFDLSLSDDMMVQCAVNLMMPPTFSRLPQIQAFARARGLFYSPAKK